MVNKTLVLAAVALASSQLAAAAEKPRLYYPRHIQRIPNRSPEVAQTTSDDKRGGLGDLVSGLFGNDGSDSTTTSHGPGTTSSHDSRLTTRDDGGLLGELFGDGSSTSGGDGGLLAELLNGGSTDKTTATKQSDSSKPAVTEPAQTSDDGGLLGPIFGSTGLLGNGGAPQTTSPAKSTDSSSDSSTKKPDATSDDGGLLGGIFGSTGLLGGGAKTTSAPDSKESAEPTTTGGGGLLSGILGGGGETTTKPSTATATDAATTDAASTTSGGLLDPILGSTGLLGGTGTTSLPSTAKPTTTGGLIGSLLSSIADHTTTQTALTTSGTDVPVVNSTSANTELPTSIPTDLPVTNSTQPTVLPTTTEPIQLTTTPAVVNSTAEATTVPVTSIPVTSAPVTIPATPVATTAPTTVPATTVAPDTTTVLPTPTAEPPTSVPATTAADTAPVTSIQATATYTNTNDWLPTTIVAEATSFTFAPPSSASSGTATSLPTNVPRVIRPDGSNKPPPPDTEVIQIGFKYPLNYMFVAENTVAAAQIFQFLPEALASASKISVDRLRVSMLVPLDTRAEWGYLTTIAKIDYPKSLVEQLQMDLWAPNSPLYVNEQQIVNNLTAVINPKIDLQGNINENESSGGSNGGSDGAGGANQNNDAFGGNGGGNSSGKTKAATAGIAIGAVACASLYGAAMFIVARRYKRKKQAHRRTSSITSSSQASSEMAYTGAGSPALMGGALLSRDFSGYGGVAGGRNSQGSGHTGTGSAWTANISAPVATENSLGWN